MVVQFTGIGVSKENKELRDAIQAALQSMIADGSYQAILKKWDLSVGAVDNIAVNKGQ